MNRPHVTGAGMLLGAPVPEVAAVDARPEANDPPGDQRAKFLRTLARIGRESRLQPTDDDTKET